MQKLSIMKKFLFFIILISFVVASYSQKSGGFNQVLTDNSSNTALIKKLKAFERSGIEKQFVFNDSFSVQALIDTARRFEGTPHCMGGTSLKCIDCSGLLYVSFTKLGITAPRTSEGFAHYGTIIASLDSLKKGDMVFFVKTYSTKRLITHSGIVVDSARNFIHTSASRGVVISNLHSAYYKKHFIFGTRFK